MLFYCYLLEKENKLKLFISIFISIFLISCVTVPLEGLHTSISLSHWKVGYQQDFGSGNGYIREFVPENESINDWSKLISIEFLEGEQRGLIEYVEYFSDKRKKQCPGTEFKILGKDEFTITYKFSFPSCLGHDEQSEVTRMFLGNDGLHRLSYAEKTSKLSDKVINYWLLKFKESYIVKGSNKKPIR